VIAITTPKETSRHEIEGRAGKPTTQQGRGERRRIRKAARFGRPGGAWNSQFGLGWTVPG